MRVLIFNWRDARHPQAGGAEAVLHEAGTLWANRGHEVALISARPTRGPRLEDEYRGMTVVRVGDRFSVYPAARREYIDHWRGWPDVVFDSINGVPFLTPLYAEEPIVAIVYHVVGRIFFEELPSPLAAVGYSLERLLPTFYHGIPVATISDSSREDLVKMGFPRSDVVVVPVGLRLPEMPPPAGRRENLVLSIGRLKGYKRLDLLVAAAKSVIDRRSDTSFVIAGRGDYGAKLTQLVRSYGVEKQVLMPGFVTDAEKEELYRRCKLQVISSEKEGWGLTILEAASHEVPTVAFDAPGARDAIVDGKTGVLVPSGDTTALADAILGLLDDEPRRQRMGEEAFRHARQFRWEDTADRLLTMARRAGPIQTARAA